MDYITLKNLLKTPANTFQKPPKHTPKYPPTQKKYPSNPPKMLQKCFNFSFFCPGTVSKHIYSPHKNYMKRVKVYINIKPVQNLKCALT